MTETREKCPVCGAALGKESSSGVACPRCQFPHAGAALFASQKSLEAWKGEVRGGRAELLRKMQDACISGRRFRVAGDAIACKPLSDGPVTLIGPRGAKNLDDPPVVQYSAAENASRNEVLLLADGTVMSSGDNSYSQCETGDMVGIRRVLATADCTYGITAEKEVVACGRPASSTVTSWRNIRDLAAGAYHVVGLTTDGRVLVGGEALNRNVTASIEAWRGVSSVTAAGNATLALRGDGVAVFAGKEGDPRRSGVAEWHDVVAVALESAYAVGLTSEGAVLLAGESRSDYLDMGRKEAAGWTNIVAIACGRSCIAAVDMDGALHLAGNIREADKIQAAWEDVRAQFMDQLIQDAVKCSALRNGKGSVAV